MEKYVLLYGNKKPEDNICITNMFEYCKSINLGWTDFDYNHNMKIIEEEIGKGITQIIFSGLEIGWDKLIEKIKQDNPQIKIKVICNTQDSLLYYEYERNNFFRLLELSKTDIIDDIAFFRKGQYETYKNLGYKCSFIRENYILKEKQEKQANSNDNINLGIYPLNYTWDKNIFNQLCIPKFIENSNLNYNKLDERMEEFLNTMRIQSNPEKIEEINDKSLIKAIIKNDAIIDTSFTEYVHPVFFISMELGVPCLIGNTSDFFEDDNELKKYVVTLAEDNPIINSEKVIEMIENKEKIKELYVNWKRKYNEQSNDTIKKFIEK